MADINTNQLQTKEEAVSQNQQNQDLESATYSIEQMQMMEAAQQTANRGKMSPTQPVTPAVIDAIYSGKDQEHPVYSRDEKGAIRTNFANLAYQTGPAKTYVDESGALDVVGRREAFAKDFEQTAKKINDYAAVAYPEFMKDYTGRTGMIRNAIGAVGTAAMSAPRGFLSVPANIAGSVMTAPRYAAESKWNSFYNNLNQDTKDRVASFIKMQIDEAENAKQALAQSGQEEFGDGMYASAQERIFSPNVQAQYGLSAEEVGALKQYKEVVEARDADMRRSLFIKDFSENFGKEGEESLADILNLTEEDKNSVTMRVAEAGGELAGNLAFFYATGRVAGAVKSVAGSASQALKGQGYLNFARATRANGAATLASNAGITAGAASRIAFQEASVVPTVFASQFNQIRTEALLSGKDLGDATAIALTSAAAESGLEFAGFKIFKRFYTDGGWMRNVLLRNILPEGLQEGSQTLAENIITQTTGVTDKQWSDVMSEVGFSLMAGMVGGAAFSAGRMRFEGMMAQFEDMADRYTHAMALVGSEKAQQAYQLAMEEIAQEEWLARHPEADEQTRKERSEARAAQRAQYQQQEQDVLAAKETIKEMYGELKDYYENRVKKLNPDITGEQLQAGWDMIKTQIGVALDGNTLTSKYYAAADHVINMYYKQMPQIDKYQTKAIRDMLTASGKYTPEQIEALTSKDHVKATNAKLDLLEKLQSDHLISQGISEAEAKASARFTRKLLSASALINPNFDARAMARKLHANVLHIRNAAFYKADELRGTPFEPVSYKMQDFTKTNTVSSIAAEKDAMTGLSKALFSQNGVSAADAAKYNQMLYGDKTFDPGLKRTKELMRSQAPLVKQVIENMPTKLTRDLSDEEVGAMWLMNQRGFSWDSIFKRFDIPMRGNRKASTFFESVSKDLIKEPTAADLKRMKRMLNRMQGEYLNFPREEGRRLQESSGLYDVGENLIILNKPQPGTAFHEYNHFSMYSILNNQLRLDEVGLLPDISLLQPLKDKLARSMRGAKWLTEREFQETLNDALFQYLDSGKCKDPIMTSYFAILKEQGYKSRVNLYASRLSKSSESELDKTQKKELMSTIDEVFGSASISDIITKANQVREHSALKGLPERGENKGMRTYHTELANKLADELQDLLNSVPVKGADEYSRQIEMARNEDYGAPITQEVFKEGQEQTNTQTIYNKGNITKLLVLGEQISAKALDFAYDVITTEKSMSEGLAESDIPLYDVAADVISPARQPEVMPISEVLENLKKVAPSWEGLKEVTNNLVNSLKDLMYSLEGASGEVANELRDVIMREVWNESIYRNLFRSSLRPVIDAKKAWLGKYSGTEKRAKELEFNRQVTANLGDGHFKEARDWMATNFGEKVAKQWDDIMFMLNGNPKKAEEWMKMSDSERKNNPIGYLYKGAKGILAESGVAIDGELVNFFPMLVRDFKGLTKQRFGHAYTYSEIDKIKARLREQYLEKTKNRDEKGKAYLSQEEENALELEVAELVNSRMQRNISDEDKVSSFFKRRFREYGKTLDKEAKDGQAVSILDYYYDPFEALDRYMDAVFRTATARHLIGHTVQMKDGKPVFTNLSSSLKEEVKKIENNKKLSAAEKERRVNELLTLNGKVGLYLATHELKDEVAVNRLIRAMHAYVSRTSSDPDDFFNWLRGVNQLTMLGSVFSALNQVNDLQYCFTLFGVKPTAKAFMDVIFNHDGKDVIKLEDIGGESSTEAFRPSDETPLGKLTRWVFQHTGFEFADVRLKEVMINSFNNYSKDLAASMLSAGKKGQFSAAEINRFNDIINEIIPNQAEFVNRAANETDEQFEERVSKLTEEHNVRKAQLLQDMVDGKQTADVKYAQWYMLNKLQPMNSATVSAHYNSTGSFGKLCWQFNTVSSRQAGFLKEHIYNEGKRGGPKQAAIAMARFAAAALAVGVPKEILEAFLRGQKPEAIDLAAVPLQAMWLNQYTLSTLKRQGIGAAAVAQFTPKSGIFNNMTKDALGVVTLNYKGYTTRNIPIVGPFVWYWLAGGRSAAIKQDKALFHHKMTREEYEAKIAEAKEKANYMKTGETND